MGVNLDLDSALALLLTTDATDQQTFASLLSRKDVDEMSVLGDFINFFDTSPPPRISFEDIEELSPVAFRAFFRAAAQCGYQCETLDFSPLNFTDETWRILMENIHCIKGVNKLVLTGQPEERIPLLVAVNPSFFSGITHFELGGDKGERLKEGTLGATLSALLKLMPQLETAALKNFTLNELPDFTNNVKLKRLDLSHNRIKTLPPAFLRWMLASTLEELDISHNDIEQDKWGDICDELLNLTEDNNKFTLSLYPQNPEYEQSYYQALHNSMQAFNITTNCGMLNVLSSTPHVVDPLHLFMSQPIELTEEWVNYLNQFLANPSYFYYRNEILEWALKSQYEILNVPRDDNCLFSAAAAQMGDFPQNLLRTLIVYRMYMRRSTVEEHFTSSYLEYLAKMANDGKWGAQLELYAIGEMLGTTVSFRATSQLRLVDGKLFPSDDCIDGDISPNAPKLYFYIAVDGEGNDSHVSALIPKDENEKFQKLNFPSIPPASCSFNEYIKNFITSVTHEAEDAIMMLWTILHRLEREDDGLLCLNDGEEPLVCQSVPVVTALIFLLFAENELTAKLDIGRVQFSDACWKQLQDHASMLHSLSVLSCTHNKETDLRRWLPFLSTTRMLDLSHNQISVITPILEAFQGNFAPSLDVSDNEIPFSKFENFLENIISQKRRSPFYNEVRIRVGKQSGNYFPPEQAVKVGPFLTLFGIDNDLMRHIPDNHNIIGLPDEIRHVLNEIFLSEKIGEKELTEINAVLQQDRFDSYRPFIVVHLLKRFFIFQENTNEKRDIISLLISSSDWDFFVRKLLEKWDELKPGTQFTPDQVIREMKTNPNRHTRLFLQLCCKMHERSIILFESHNLFTLCGKDLCLIPAPDSMPDPLFIFRDDKGESYILQPKQ